jgi:hypothetical protein
MAAAHDLTADDPAGNRGLNPDIDRRLLIRAEDAGLNASAPPLGCCASRRARPSAHAA